MALLDPIHYAFIKATVMAPREEDTEVATLEKLVDSLWNNGFGAFTYEYCSFIATQCPIPDKMHTDMTQQGLKVPKYGLMLLTFTLENGQEHYLA